MTSRAEKVTVSSILAAVVLGSTAGVLTDIFQACFDTQTYAHTGIGPAGCDFPAGLNQFIDPLDSSSQIDVALNKYIFVNDEFTDTTDNCGSCSLSKHYQLIHRKFFFTISLSFWCFWLSIPQLYCLLHCHLSAVLFVAHLKNKANHTAVQYLKRFKTGDNTLYCVSRFCFFLSLLLFLL